MIFRIIPEENYKLIPLTHIPPDKEDEFWEKNKDTGLYIKADIITVFSDCVKYDPTTKKVYNDFKCIHQRRIERKKKDFRSSTKQIITEYLTKMDWGSNYYESCVEILSILRYLEEHQEQLEECYKYVKLLHETIEEIWFLEKDIEDQVEQTTDYEQLLQYDVYKFITEQVKPRLEKIYNVYLRCKTNKCCRR